MNTTMAYLTVSEARQLEHDGFNVRFITWTYDGLLFEISKEGE